MGNEDCRDRVLADLARCQGKIMVEVIGPREAPFVHLAEISRAEAERLIRAACAEKYMPYLATHQDGSHHVLAVTY